MALVAATSALAQPLPEFKAPQRAAPKAKAEKSALKVKSLPVPDDAVRMALADVLSLPPHDRCFVRYLFVPEGDEQSMRVSSLVVNYVSRGSTVVRPFPLYGRRLLRLDLRWYAPREQDLKEVMRTWEELAFDPGFSLLITKDTIDFARLDKSLLPRRRVKKVVEEGPVAPTKKTIFVDHPGGPYVYPDDSGRVSPYINPGRYRVELEFRPKPKKAVTSTEEEVTFGDKVFVVRFNPPGIDPKALSELQELTQTQAPVVGHEYFRMRALNTIKDDKVFKAVFGGLYYDFRGVKKAKDVLGKDTKATDLDLFFEGLGIGNIKGGLSAEALFDKLRSDQGIVIMRSQVTGGPREVLAFNTPAAKEGTGWGAISGDMKQQNIDIGDRVFANLLTPRRDAREAIFPQANGLLVFGLFNGAGDRQDEAPPDVAADRTVPQPHPTRLQIFGCVTCHSTVGKDGWQPMQNDIKKMLGTMDLFDDKGLRGRLNSDVIDRLAGKYTGDFRKNLTRARDDLAEATLKATGPWKESQDQTDVCKLAAQRIHDEHNAYFWELVTPQRALKELGLDVDKDHALEVFRQVVPPDTRAFAHGIVPEDPRIGALRAGVPINRTDWALSYSFAAERALSNPVYRKLREVKRDGP